MSGVDSPNDHVESEDKTTTEEIRITNNYVHEETSPDN